jgi:hypothetical protein
MKQNFLKGLVLSLLLAGLSAQATTLGREGGNGGDIVCDAQIKKIADNIQMWTINRGPESGNKLNLSSSVSPGTNPSGPYTLAQYEQAMSALLSKPLDSSCVTQGDSAFPVQVEGRPKICKTLVDGLGVHMVCDLEKFLALNQDLQIQQIHHEFATSIPGLEVDDGPISSYKISGQLSAFIATVTERKLVVLPPPVTHNDDPDMFDDCRPVIDQAVRSARSWDADKPEIEINHIRLVKTVQHQHLYLYYSAEVSSPWNTAGKVLVEASTGGCNVLNLKLN